MTQFPLLVSLRGVESEVTKRGKEIALKGTSEQRAAATIGKPNTFFIPFESRAVMSASTSQANIGNERQELIFPLEENLVLAKAGARIVTGLTGNALYPKSTGAVVNWAGENEKAADGA